MTREDINKTSPQDYFETVTELASLMFSGKLFNNL